MERNVSYSFPVLLRSVAITDDKNMKSLSLTVQKL